MTEVRVALSQGSVKRALHQLKEYRRRVAGLPEGLTALLAKRTARTALGLAEAGLPRDDELPTVLPVRKGRGSWMVEASGPDVAFIEFGTGVVGRGTYPGQLPVEWPYDLRLTPAAHDRKDPTAWWYFVGMAGTGKLGNKRMHKTRGNVAAGFMMRAADGMRSSVAKTAEEVLKG